MARSTSSTGATLQHCHNPADEKWDRTNGRIYRVSWAATYHPVKVDLGDKSDLELATLQTHHNDWYCRQARAASAGAGQTRKIDPAAHREAHASSPRVAAIRPCFCAASGRCTPSARSMTEAARRALRASG